MKRIINQPILETNLTLFGAYLLFYTAESESAEIGVSGILGLVALGLYMTRSGRLLISHQAEETLHHIWQFLGYTCETLVFFIAGVIITLNVWEKDSVIVWQDYFKCIALYVFLHIIRAGVIFTIRWPMSKLGYGLNWREALVLSCSGLRGAVSLALALIVKLDHDVDHHIRDIVIFHTAGVALLTLIVNGSLIGFLVKGLGMMRMTDVKKKMIRNLIKTYKKEVNETIETLKGKKNFGKVDWDVLKEVAGTTKIKYADYVSDDESAEIIDMKDDYTFDQLYIEAKHRYLTSLKGIYWENYMNGQCSSRSVTLLIESSCRAIDHVAEELKDFDFIRTYFIRGWFDRLYIKLQRVWPFKYFISDWLYQRLSFEYDAVVNYIEAHEEGIETIEQIVNNEAILEKLKIELQQQIHKAEIKLYNHLEDNFPEVIKAIQHRRGGHFLINHMSKFVGDMVNHGQMQPKEAQYFYNHLSKQERKLILGHIKIEFEHPDEDMITHSQFSKIFSADEIHELGKHFKEKQFDRNEVVIKKGSTLKYIYYISKGVIHEKAGEVKDVHCPKIKNRPGDLIGLQFIGKDSGDSFTNCYAKTVCTCRMFPIAELRKLIKTPEQEIKLWCYVGPSIFKLRPDQFSRFHDLTEREISALLLSSSYKSYEPNAEVKFATGGILIEGIVQKQLKDDEEDSSVHSSVYGSDDEDAEERGLKFSSCFIYPSDKNYIAKEECKVFHMPQSLKEGLLSLDPHVFSHAFHELPRVQYLDKHHKVQNHYQNLKKEKTTLLGIPKQMAYDDPVEVFRDKRKAIQIKYGRGGDKSMARGSSRKSSRRNSIVPRGLVDSNKHIPFHNDNKGKSNKDLTNIVHPEIEKPLVRERALSVERDQDITGLNNIHDSNWNSNDRINDILGKKDTGEKDKLSVIESSEASNVIEEEGNDTLNKL